jgi:hypothetical protein
MSAHSQTSVVMYGIRETYFLYSDVTELKNCISFIFKKSGTNEGLLRDKEPPAILQGRLLL